MALAVLLLVNPYAIASVDLRLSFASTLGLILFAGKLQHALEKPFAGAPKLVRKALAVSSRGRTLLHGLRYDIYSTDSADLVRRGVVLSPISNR